MSRGGGRAVAIVWTMWAVVVAAIVVTYTRLPPEKLYNVVGHGFVDGGLSRAVVYVNFPVGLGAVYSLLATAEWMSRRARLAAVAAFLLWTPVFSGRVLSQSYLDARWGNVFPAVGVALAVVLTLATPPVVPEHVRGDAVRVGVGAVLVFVALPWIAAELGTDFTGVPILGQIFQTHELRAEPGVEGLHPAVHYGDHHGFEATLLILTALIMSRMLGAVVSRQRHAAFGFASALLIAYGLMNVANDAWLEQVVKRGWTNWEIPGVLEPRVNWGWLVILVATIVLWVSCFRPRPA